MAAIHVARGLLDEADGPRLLGLVAALAVDAAEARDVRLAAIATLVALPGAAAKPVLELLPIADDLNQEVLSVTGLSAGQYEVKIDGMAVRLYASDELAKGVNLAFNETTAQAKQARCVAQLNEQRRNAEAQACSLLNTRRWMQSHYKVSVDDPAAVQAHYDRFKDKTEYSAVMALNYIKQWPKYGELRKNVEELEKKVLAARAPVSHAYAVVPAAAGTK